MKRDRANCIHQKVNSLLSTCDFDTTLDGLLPHANTLCLIRCLPQELLSSDHDIEPTTREQGEDSSSTPDNGWYDRPSKARTTAYPMACTISPLPESLSGSYETLKYIRLPSSTLGPEVTQIFQQPVIPPIAGWFYRPPGPSSITAPRQKSFRPMRG
jgi:hypothetical protein